MKKASIFSKIITYLLVFVGTVGMILFIYLLIKISFQTGESSKRITQTLSYKMGWLLIGEQPSIEIMSLINRLIRYLAHIALFWLLGYGLGIILFMINRRPLTRLISVIFDWAVSFGLAYFTEYYKKYIPGRHFQLEDVRANMIGALFGICFFLISLAMFEVIHARRKSNSED